MSGGIRALALAALVGSNSLFSFHSEFWPNLHHFLYVTARARQGLDARRPAVTRALDRLSDLGYARRQKDPQDRRSVQVQRTVKGSVFLSEFAEVVAQSARNNR